MSLFTDDIESEVFGMTESVPLGRGVRHDGVCAPLSATAGPGRHYGWRRSRGRKPHYWQGLPPEVRLAQEANEQLRRELRESQAQLKKAREGCVEKIVENVIEVPDIQVVEKVVEVPLIKKVQKFVEVPKTQPIIKCTLSHNKH